jgi:hypothetical protein
LTFIIKAAEVYGLILAIPIALTGLLSAAQAATRWLKQRSFSGLRSTPNPTDICVETPLI